MKKTLIVAAVSASFSVAANAQSSVTLYGLLDAGITYTSNVGGNTNVQQTSGGIDQSRWGLRGSEDLGNGLKAIFTLESGFNLGNGGVVNNGGMFNRQSFVGLSSNYGTVTLGRQYGAEQDFLAPLTATGSWGGTSFAHVGNYDNMNTNGGTAVNNSVKFTSANYEGFSFGTTYGFSNQGEFSNNRAYSFGAAYQFQGLHLAASFTQRNNPLSTNSNGATSGLIVPDSLNALGNFRQRIFGAGASYEFGPAQVGFVWTQANLGNAENSPGSIHQNNYEVNAKYKLTPALDLGVAYTYTQLTSSLSNVDSHQHFNQLGVQADYAISKRTDFYAEVVYQRASGEGARAEIYNPTTGGGLSSSVNQTAATIGLRHRF
jgi:predicted porin